MAERVWQAKAYKVFDRAIASDKTELISMPACVGSGKTRVCAYGFGKFIQEHKNDETIQMFVTPRIKLCDQQSLAISNTLKELFAFEEGTDYKIIPIDCTKNIYNKKDPQLINETKHTIFVICDASLWGKDKQAANLMIRFETWIKTFKQWKEEGKLFGCIAFDEAHNYQNQQYEMFGKEIN